MDSILEYASSPSPPSSPRCDSAPARSSLFGAFPQTASDAIKKRLLVPQHLACQSRSFTHRSTREEDAFAFRGYAVKRRRRNRQSEVNSPQSISSTTVKSAGSVSSDSRLFEDDEEIPIMSTTDSKLEKMLPLRRQNRLRFIGHSKAINELQWHRTYPQLFLSASMDATVRVWKTFAGDKDKCQRVLTHHSLGVKSAKWSLDGKHILTGGYDGRCCYIDAETGQTQTVLRRPDLDTVSTSIERITTVHFHPTEPNSLLLGTDTGRIYSHDLREKTPQYPVATFTKSFGDVHDLLFLGDDGQRFVSCAGVTRRDASNQTLLVWDLRSATLLYDRLDDNMLAHTCLRAHPNKRYFVAQCVGNYASLYSTRAPYKRVKGRSISGHRPPLQFSGGHEVEGYKIQCSFSSDGSLWASGDATGRVVIYRTADKRGVLESYQLYGKSTSCLCAEFSPSSAESLSSRHALLAGSSAGDIDLFQ